MSSYVAAKPRAKTEAVEIETVKAEEKAVSDEPQKPQTGVSFEILLIYIPHELSNQSEF